MEGEQRHYELRSRSRSRSQTPLVQNCALAEPEVLEHHYDLRTRSQERSQALGETVNSRKTTSRSLHSNNNKSYDQCMEAIEERREEVVTNESLLESRNRRLGSSSITAEKKGDRRSERYKGRKQAFVNGQSDRKGNFSEQKVERKCKDGFFHRTITSDYSSEEGEREDPLNSGPNSAHEIYKQAGDWWNVFPKTDYTYSEKSQCRYEIAPGVLAMPNMSRRSIHSDFDSLNRFSYGLSESGVYETEHAEDNKETSAQNCTSVDEYRRPLSASSYTSNCDAKSKIQYSKTHVEQYRSHREAIYSVPRKSRERQSLDSAGTPIESISCRRFNVTSTVDSDTELEEFTVNSNRKWNIAGRLTNFTAIIVLWISKLLEFLKLSTVRKRELDTSPGYHRYHELKWHKMWQSIDHFSQYVYLFMVRVFFFDSWLLSRVSNFRRWIHRRGSKVFWIVLLPLLLFTGTYILQKQSLIRLDSLHNVAYDVTEMCYRILNNITDLIPFDNNSFVKHVAKLQNLQIHFLSNVNVSLPKMPSMGYWYLPHLSTAFPSTKLVVSQFRRTSEVLAEKATLLKDDLDLIVQELNSRISRLEDSLLKKSDRLMNVSETLRQLNERDSIWVEYNNKILSLEKRLEQHETGDSYASEIQALKLQFETLKELYSELKVGCSSNGAYSLSDEYLEKRVETILAHYFGSSALERDMMMNAIRNLMVQAKHLDRVGQEDLRRGSTMEIALTEDSVRDIVKEALKIYNADKTGRVDYALEPAGGQIISTRCTQRYDVKTRAFKLLAFTLYHENNNPRTVIQGNPIQPGACWAFQGFPGYLLIKLRNSIYVTGFTVEHAPKSILPNGEMKSAPRKFNVWGLVDENDPAPVMFGDYEFAATDDSLQYFPVQNTTVQTAYEYVELRIHSNHGQLEYTCLYRFRVHGRSV